MEKVWKFLKANSVMTLATSFDDRPRASIIEYVMVGNSIVFGTAEDSIKANNLKHNKHLSVSVNGMPIFITIDGTLAHPTEHEVHEYNRVILERHPEMKEMFENDTMGKIVHFKVHVEAVYYNDYSKGMAPTEIIKL